MSTSKLVILEGLSGRFNMKRKFHPLNRPSKPGQGLVEYALILVLVSIAVIAIISLLGRAVQNTYEEVVEALEFEAPEIRDCGGQRTGRISNSTWQEEWTFPFTAGQRVSIAMDRSSGNLDPYLKLLNPSGGQVASDDDSGSGLNSFISYFIPSDGNYTVVATRYRFQRGRSNGNYALTVTCSTVTEETCESFTGNISNSNRSDDWSYSGTAGQRITINMTATSGNLDTYIYLRNSSGEEIDHDDDGGPSLNSRLSRTLSSTAIYIIEATRYRGASGSSSGNYTLEVCDY